MLMAGAASVASVAYEVGYENSTQFSREWSFWYCSGEDDVTSLKCLWNDERGVGGRLSRFPLAEPVLAQRSSAPLPSSARAQTHPADEHPAEAFHLFDTIERLDDAERTSLCEQLEDAELSALESILSSAEFDLPDVVAEHLETLPDQVAQWLSERRGARLPGIR